MRRVYLTVCCLMALVAGSCSDATSPNRPWSLIRDRGDEQTGDLGALLADSLAVWVLDRNGDPLRGVGVTWRVLAGGGSITPSSETDTRGITTAGWTLGTRLDTTYVALASVSGLSAIPFTATPRLPSTAVIAMVRGDAQIDTVEATLRDSLVVAVRLADGRAAIGVPVTWSPVGGRGGVSAAAAKTDSAGRVAARWTLGGLVGTDTVLAAAGSTLTLGFTTTVQHGNPAVVGVQRGDRQSDLPSTVLPDSLAVAVRDRLGNLVSGVRVGWAVATGGGTVSPSIDASDQRGEAQAQWTLGSSLGEQTVVATAAGLDAALFRATAGGFVSVTASYHATCGLFSDTRAYCWGRNGYGQVGDGTGTDRWTPVGVSGPLVFESLSPSGLHTCGIRADGAAHCWGWNGDGQLGDATTTSSSTPVAVTGGLTFQAISAGAGLPSGHSQGGGHTCGLTPSGVAYCWGWNNYGRLGDGTMASSSAPVAVSGGLTFQAISTAYDHTCGLTPSGVAYCWGFNQYGQLGDGTSGLETYSSTPVAVSGGLTFQAISAGWRHTCALTPSGVAYCWGSNGGGQLGDGTTTTSSTPVAVTGGVIFQAISAESRHTCGLTPSGVTYCWGLNEYGQLGDGTTTSRSTPVAVSGGLTFQAISAGWSYTCGLTPSGAAYCWGENAAGELGNGTTGNSAVPMRVGNP